MGIRRYVYPGGNTRYGFYSFYDQIAGPEIVHKIILKGGPGVGKSIFMKSVAEEFAQMGADVEEHGCSSDPDSLDGVVIGKQQFCLVDGTKPHMVDPIYPGAVDEILNLGDYWNRDLIRACRQEIVLLTHEIAASFNCAYSRLSESALAGDELKDYHRENRVSKSLYRNIQALVDDYLMGTTPEYQPLRHLFAGALTPEGMKTRLDTLINNNTAIFAVKGSPGAGVQDLFKHCLHLMEKGGLYGEVFHNPIDPHDVDYILLPSSNALLIDISPVMLPYKEIIKGMKLKRQLDFDQLLDSDGVARRAKLIFSAAHRYNSGINDTVEILDATRRLRDELEAYYKPAMDFAAVDRQRELVINRWKEQL